MSDDLDLAQGQPSSSLASTCQMVTELPQHTCGIYDPRFVIDLVAQRIYPARCRRNVCPTCRPINARRRALAISYVRPRRMLRFSLLAEAGTADPMEQARTRMKRLRQALRRAGVPSGEWSWTLEPNPKGTGYHAHAVQHGPYIAQGALQHACDKAGAGFPWIREIHAAPDQVARYGLKAFGAAGYGLKTFKSADYAEEALRLNHGRLEHHTRGFFEMDGSRLAPRDVERLAVVDLYGPGLESYIVVPEDVARFYVSPEGRKYLPRPVLRPSESDVSRPPG